MHKQDETALQVLISFLESVLITSAGKLDEDTIAKLNTLLTLCKGQGTKDEKGWFTEIAQAVFEFCEKAPTLLVEVLEKMIKG
jgi:hypothetical protein